MVCLAEFKGRKSRMRSSNIFADDNERFDWIFDETAGFFYFAAGFADNFLKKNDIFFKTDLSLADCVLSYQYKCN